VIKAFSDDIVPRVQDLKRFTVSKPTLKPEIDPVIERAMNTLKRIEAVTQKVCGNNPGQPTARRNLWRRNGKGDELAAKLKGLIQQLSTATKETVAEVKKE
jgi:hypothetical protein